MAQRRADAVGARVAPADHHDVVVLRRDVRPVLQVRVEEALRVPVQELHREVDAREAAALDLELWRDGVILDQPRQETLAEQAHQPHAVPLRQRLPGAVRRPAPGGREQVDVGLPLKEVPGGSDGDDDAGARVIADSPADQLARGLGGRAPQLGEQLGPPSQQRAVQPRDGQHDVAVGGPGEHVLAQPLGPRDLALLLARRAERPDASLRPADADRSAPPRRRKDRGQPLPMRTTSDRPPQRSSSSIGARRASPRSAGARRASDALRRTGRVRRRRPNG